MIFLHRSYTTEAYKRFRWERAGAGYKNQGDDGRNSLCGEKVKRFRMALPGKPSQKKLADSLQRAGADLDKNAIQRMECGKRLVTDIKRKALARVLNVRYEHLLDDEIK